MSNAKRVDAKERANIVSLLREHGGNRNKVAKICKRSPSTVQGIAEAEGIESNIRAPKNANEARRDFALAERLELLNKAFIKGEMLIEGTWDAKDFKDLVLGIATLIDKRRLEDGEATSRSENLDPAEAQRRQRIRENLDEVAAQRRKRLAG